MDTPTPDKKPKPFDLRGRLAHVGSTGQVTFYDSKQRWRTGQLQCSDEGELSVEVLPYIEPVKSS